MAEVVILPKLGNSVESCILVGWKVALGDQVAEGTVLCEAETDKTTVEVESTAAGTLLHLFFQEDDEIEVFAPIAIVGEAGEDVSSLIAEQGGGGPGAAQEAPLSNAELQEELASALADMATAVEEAANPAPDTATTADGVPTQAQETTATPVGISPRARNAAENKGVPANVLQGTGPGGRVIERDVLAYAATHEPLTPAARAQLQGQVPPATGSGIGGRVTAYDIATAASGATGAGQAGTSVAGVTTAGQATATQSAPSQSTEAVRISLKGVRKIIAERMHHSMQSTAQLTLNSYADVSYIKKLRERFKSLPAEHPLARVSLNDMVLFAVVKSLQKYPAMNAHFLGTEIVQYPHVNLGFAVDTPKGLMVPNIKAAETASLADIASQTKEMGGAAKAGNINPDHLQGGTFTITNLGILGVEHFTPVLNAPEVGILGVGAISLRPIQRGIKVAHIPHMALSLTIDHQVIDGAPAGRFLQDVADNIKNFDMLFMQQA